MVMEMSQGQEHKLPQPIDMEAINQELALLPLRSTAVP